MAQNTPGKSLQIKEIPGKLGQPYSDCPNTGKAETIQDKSMLVV
jgi:hypothetical protein